MLRLLLAAALAVPPLVAQQDVDLEAVHRIRQEAFKRSQVMDHLFHLVEVHGPRITGSPGFQASAEWAAGRLEEWGMENVLLEEWGPFGRGWSRSYFSAHLVEPGYETLIGVPLGWSPSTDGVVEGTPAVAVVKRYPTFKRDEESIDRFIAEHRGKLGGAIVLLAEPVGVEVAADPLHRRLDDAALKQRAEAPEPVEPVDFDNLPLEIPDDPAERSRVLSQAPPWFNEWRKQERWRIQGKLNSFLVAEGVRLVIHPGFTGDGGTVFPPRMSWKDPDHPLPPPAIALTPEHYNRLYRLADRGLEPKIEVEVRTTIHDDDPDSLNVVGEIPGGAKADEIVMIGGHLDSTAAALGATDNGAGCAVMLEAMRILKTLDLKLDRTVRIALWGGEEQGLLGSKAYVKEHFGDPETMQLKPEHARLAAYFNVDNGTGKIRGVYLQENDMVRPIFASWLRPFDDLGAQTLSIRNTGGTDHLSFDAVGLPGFQFIQDPIEYGTRTHHSNMDGYDRAQPGDLMQAAAIVASFVYHAANRADKLPRKPLPEPQPLTRP